MSYRRIPKRLKTGLFSSLLILSGLPAVAQIDNLANLKKVLKLNKPGKAYSFLPKDSSGLSVVRYLGQIHGRTTIKVVTSAYTWDSPPRSQNRVVLFGAANQYLGNYPVPTTPELPVRISAGKLVFENTAKKNCDTTLVTSIDLSGDIPAMIFIPCQGKDGGLYNFEKKPLPVYPATPATP